MTEPAEDQAAKNAINSKATLIMPEDEGLEDVLMVYHALNQAVKSWQDGNAGRFAAWRPAESSTQPTNTCTVTPATTLPSGPLLSRPGRPRRSIQGQACSCSLVDQRTPIFTLAELPVNLVLDLWQHLNARIGVHSTTQELDEQFRLFKKSGTLQDAEMLTSLNLALSGIAGQVRRQISHQELESVTQGWEKSACPVCGEETHLALLLPPAGKRYLFCRVCGHQWPVRRVGCILCGNEEAKKQVYLHAESYPGVEMVVCQACGKGFKEIDLRERACDDYIWEDLRTLPLNYAAGQWLERQNYYPKSF